MPFDPNQPFEKLDAAPTAGGFDPSKPFEKLDEKPTMPVAKSEGTFDQHIDEISKKYGVSPKSLRDYALDIGSVEAAKSSYAPKFMGKASPYIEKIQAVTGGAAESLMMGLPGKLERKISGYIKSPEYEKALDEVTELVETRKPFQQKAGEFAIELAMPAGVAGKVLGKATTTLGKLGIGAAGGAATGALSGLGASKAGEELQAAGIGAGVGGAIGGVIPAVGSVVGEAFDTKKLAQSFIRPKAGEAAEELIKGEEAKLPQMVSGVVDYARRQTAEGNRVNPIFKATSRKKLIDNITNELDSLGTKIEKQIESDGDKLFEAIYFKDANNINRNILYDNIRTEIGNLRLKLIEDAERGAISRKEGKKALNILSERVESKLINLKDEPAKLLQKSIELRRGLQEAASRAYEPGKKLSPSDQLMKDMAARINNAIYNSLPGDELKALNKDYSNLIGYRDALARGEAKKTLDKLYETISTGAVEVLVNAVVPTKGVITVGNVFKNFAQTDFGKLARIQLGEAKFNQMIREGIQKLPPDVGSRIVRETIKETQD